MSSHNVFKDTSNAALPTLHSKHHPTGRYPNRGSGSRTDRIRYAESQLDPATNHFVNPYAEHRFGQADEIVGRITCWDTPTAPRASTKEGGDKSAEGKVCRCSKVCSKLLRLDLPSPRSLPPLPPTQKQLPLPYPQYLYQPTCELRTTANPYPPPVFTPFPQPDIKHELRLDRSPRSLDWMVDYARRSEKISYGEPRRPITKEDGYFRDPGSELVDEEFNWVDAEDEDEDAQREGWEMV